MNSQAAKHFNANIMSSVQLLHFTTHDGSVMENTGRDESVTRVWRGPGCDGNQTGPVTWPDSSFVQSHAALSSSQFKLALPSLSDYCEQPIIWNYADAKSCSFSFSFAMEASNEFNYWKKIACYCFQVFPISILTPFSSYRTILMKRINIIRDQDPYLKLILN